MLRKSGIAVIGHPVEFGEIDPCVAIRHAHHEVSGDESEGEHRLDRQRDQLRIGGRPGLAEDVHVELMKLAPAALLRLLVAETLADLEPLERLGEMPLVLGHEARQRGGHLRAQRDVAPALVLEAEELARELAAGFFQIERGVLENRRLVFDVAAAAGHRAPGLEQIIADRAFTGNEIAESGQRLK